MKEQILLTAVGLGFIIQYHVDLNRQWVLKVAHIDVFWIKPDTDLLFIGYALILLGYGLSYLKEYQKKQ